MAQLWCTGPAHIFVGNGGSASQRTVQYLGTAEQAPQIIIDPQYEQAFNDVGGGLVPIDELYQGEVANVSMVLTRWNEDVLQDIRSLPNFATNSPGAHGSIDLGTLMLSEGCTYPLYIKFPYAQAKTAMAGMPNGYRFWAAKNVGPFQVMPGTSLMRKQLIFNCLRHWGLGSPLSGPALQKDVAPSVGILYDFDISQTDGVQLN